MKQLIYKSYTNSSTDFLVSLQENLPGESSYLPLDGSVSSYVSLILTISGLNLHKNDIITNVTLKFETSATSGQNNISLQANGTLIDYSTNRNETDSIYFDITHLFLTDFNNNKTFTLNRNGNNNMTFYLRQPSDNGLCPELIIKYIPAFDFIDNQNKISGSIGDDMSYSLFLPSSLFNVSLKLFPTLLPFELSFIYSSYNPNQANSIFPKGWNLNLLSSLIIESNQITLINASQIQRVFLPVPNESGSYFDSSGSGRLLKLINNEYHLYSNTFDEDSYSVFSLAGDITSIHLLGYGDITITRDTSSLTITDYNGNVVTFLKSTRSSLSSLTISLSGFNSNYYSLLGNNSNSLTNLNSDDGFYSFSYDLSNNLIQIISPSNDTLKLSYDSNKRINKLEEGTRINNVNTFSNSYSITYQLFKYSITDFHNVMVNYTYDDELRLLSAYEPEKSNFIGAYKHSLVSSHNIPFNSLSYKCTLKNGNNESASITLSSSNNNQSVSFIGSLSNNETFLNNKYYVLAFKLDRSPLIYFESDHNTFFSAERSVYALMECYDSNNNLVYGTSAYVPLIINEATNEIIFPFKFIETTEYSLVNKIKITFYLKGDYGSFTFNDFKIYESLEQEKEMYLEVSDSYQSPDLVINFKKYKKIISLKQYIYSTPFNLSYQDFIINKLRYYFSSPSFIFYNRLREIISFNNQYNAATYDGDIYINHSNNIALISKSQTSDSSSLYLEAQILKYDPDNTNYFIIETIKKHGVIEEITKSYYDKHFRLIKTIDKDGIVSLNTYSSANNLTSNKVYLENNLSKYFETTYSYNRHRLTQESYFSSTSVVSKQYTYKNYSEICTKYTNPNSNSFDYSYSTNYKYLTKNRYHLGMTVDDYTQSSYSTQKLSNTSSSNHTKYLFTYDKYNLLASFDYEEYTSGGGGITPFDPLEPIGPISIGDTYYTDDPPTYSKLIEFRNEITSNGKTNLAIYKNHDVIISEFDKYSRLTSLRCEKDGVSQGEATYLYADLDWIINNFYPYNSPMFDIASVPNDYISSESKLIKITDDVLSCYTLFFYYPNGLVSEIYVTDAPYSNMIATESFAYDSLFRPTRVAFDYVAPFAATIRTYEYDGLEKQPYKEFITLDSQTSPTFAVEIHKDSFGRASQIDEKFTFSKGFIYSYDYFTNGTLLSNLVSSIAITSVANSSNYSVNDLTYDNNGNITSITETIHEGNQTPVTYHRSFSYSSTGVLLRDNNEQLGKSTKYAYDSNGNIKTIVSGTYSTSSTIPNSTTKTFTYSSTFPDLLTDYNGSTIEYDAYLNPIRWGTTYYEWTRGRLLSKWQKGSTTVTFTYNDSGLRTSKTVGYTTRLYFYNSSNQLTYETTIGNVTSYYYSLNGIVGFKYNGNLYYYKKNIFGDITHIYNSSGNLVATYKYDAYGNTIVCNPNGIENTSSSFIGNINPFRYRGYYYDKETGLYYCKSRYYNPTWCRWLNADSLDYLDNTEIGGINLFSYCHNNPVMFKDETGHLPTWAKWVIGGVTFAISIALTVATAGSLAPLFIGMGISILGGALVGGLSYTIENKDFWDGFAEGAADGAMWGGIFSLVASLFNVVSMARQGYTIGKYGVYQDVARATGTNYYRGMKSYNFVKSILGEKTANTLAWTQNKFVLKTVMLFRGPIFNAVSPLTGTYAKEVALITSLGYKYFYEVWPY